MTLLSKDQILQADDRKTEDVAVPEWGGTVRLRSLSGAERDEFENGIQQQVGNKQVINARNARAKLVALCAVDEAGQLLFSKADVIKLGSKSSLALQRVYDVACKMNGFTEEDMKDLTENFGEGPSESSTSVSPPTSVAVPSLNSWQPSAHVS